MDFLQRNLFTKLRSENFGTQEELEAMTTFKKKKIAQMMKNLNNVPSGEVLMHNSFLNRRLTKIQKEEPHVIDTSMETVYLLRLIVSNANAMLSGGISIRGIIQLGQYLRTRGDKVDFVKLDNWLTKLHLQRMAQLEGSVLITFFNFEQDEIPFVKLVERGAYKFDPSLTILQHQGHGRHQVPAITGRIRAYYRRFHAQEPAPKYEILRICTNRICQQLLQRFL